MYRMLIVEDEADAAAALRDAIRRYGDEHAEQFQVGWMRNTIDIDEPAFDLIFMDIDLGIENGMEAAREIREFDRSTPIIFVTNLAQYAVQGYEVNALDFIVKPFTYGSFSLRMDRAMEVLRRREGRSITVQTRDGLRIFPASSLVRVWMRGHNVNYGLSDSSTAAARGSLKETEEMLGGTPFLKNFLGMHHQHGTRPRGARRRSHDVRRHRVLHQPCQQATLPGGDLEVPGRKGGMSPLEFALSLGTTLAPLVELLIPVIVIASSKPRREPFTRRAAVATGIAAAMELVTTPLVYIAIHASAEPIAGVRLFSLGSSVVLLVCLVPYVMYLYETSVWQALFCAGAGYTIQNLASGTSELLTYLLNHCLGIHVGLSMITGLSVDSVPLAIAVIVLPFAMACALLPRVCTTP